MIFSKQQSQLIENAITTSNLEELKKVITPDNIDHEFHGSPNYYGSILPYCCEKKIDLKIINFLLDSGANVNDFCSNGFSALYYAIRSKKYDIIDILLERGADINQNAPINITPLTISIDENDYQSLEKLLKYDSQKGVKIDINKLLHTALETRDVSAEIIEMIIKEGADVNEKNSDNKTPLSLAIRRQKQEIVSMLIAYGADVNEKIADIYPLELALDLNRNDIIDTLIDNGGALEEEDDSRLSKKQNDKKEHNLITFRAFERGKNEDFSHFSDLGNDATINQDYFIRLCEKYGIPPMKKIDFIDTLIKIQEKNNKIYSSLDSIYLHLEPIINAQLHKLDETTYPSPATTNILKTDKTDIGQKALDEFTKHRSQFFRTLFHKEQNYQFLLDIIKNSCKNSCDYDTEQQLIEEVKKLILPHPEHIMREKMLREYEVIKEKNLQFRKEKSIIDNAELDHTITTLEESSGSKGHQKRKCDSVYDSSAGTDISARSAKAVCNEHKIGPTT